MVKTDGVSISPFYLPCKTSFGLEVVRKPLTLRILSAIYVAFLVSVELIKSQIIYEFQRNNSHNVTEELISK